MKKNAGFTLIELLVAIVLMGIIFGSLVSLFSQSVTNQQAGVSQQELFTQSRAMMAEIKNTLRYADTSTIKYYTGGTETIVAAGGDFTGITKMTYTSTISSSNYNNATIPPASITIEIWQPTGWINKQLKVTDSRIPTKPYLFPEKDANSSFIAAKPFPVILANPVSGSVAELYTIDLPMKYMIAGSLKEEHLMTSVYPFAY